MRSVKNILFLLGFFILVVSCLPSKNQKTFKSLKENNFNFSNLKTIEYLGLKVKLPTYFVDEYSKAFLLKKDGLALYNPETSMYFSIERFDTTEVNEFLLSFEAGSTQIWALNSSYTDLRANTLINTKVSIPTSKKYNPKFSASYLQYIQGYREFGFGSEMVYMQFTLEKKFKGKYFFYVLQLIVPVELAKYLNDDFKRLINSAK